jgi:hypothetical protein
VFFERRLVASETGTEPGRGSTSPVATLREHWPEVEPTSIGGMVHGHENRRRPVQLLSRCSSATTAFPLVCPLGHLHDLSDGSWSAASDGQTSPRSTTPPKLPTAGPSPFPSILQTRTKPSMTSPCSPAPSGHIDPLHRHSAVAVPSPAQRRRVGRPACCSRHLDAASSWPDVRCNHPKTSHALFLSVVQ